MNEAAPMAMRELKLRRRLRADFSFYAERNLKIAVKDPKGSTALFPLLLNDAQEYLHAKIEAQRLAMGRVRVIVLKGRQQGVSTYTEGRFYWKTSHRKGVKTFIQTHQQQATDNLFTMVERYHEHCNPLVKPHVGASNSKELVFDRLDSRYSVATAGSKGAGRSATIHFFHGSEVAFWSNASEHIAGALQAVPDADGTEVVLESTANGIVGDGSEFYRLCMEAMKGASDFILIFVPWFWQKEYRREAAEDFALDTEPDQDGDGELTEAEYAEAYGLDHAQMAWRRRKIADLGYWNFKREYPATVAEAFASSGEQTLIPTRLILRARKSTITSEGPLLVGVDPARFGEDATAVIRRRRRRAYDPQLFNKLTGPQVARLVWRIIKNERPAKLFFDVGGLGGPIFDQIIELPGIPPNVLVPVNFGTPASDPERYKNARAEMYAGIKEWLEDPAGVKIPDDDLLQAELSSAHFTYDANDALQLRSKEWMRSHGIASPNLADALAMTFFLPIDALSDVARGIVEAEGLMRDGWPSGDREPNEFPIFDE